MMNMMSYEVFGVALLSNKVYRLTSGMGKLESIIYCFMGLT